MTYLNSTEFSILWSSWSFTIKQEVIRSMAIRNMNSITNNAEFEVILHVKQLLSFPFTSNILSILVASFKFSEWFPGFANKFWWPQQLQIKKYNIQIVSCIFQDIELQNKLKIIFYERISDLLTTEVVARLQLINY